MKRWTLLFVAMVFVAISASGQGFSFLVRGQAKIVGTFHAQDIGNDYKDVSPAVWAYSSGMIYLDTNRVPYFLTAKDRDSLVSLVQQSAHYCQVAKANSTTVDYTKEVGEFVTEDGARVVVKFVTHGWEHCGVEVWTFNGGRNIAWLLTTQDVNDMVRALSAVSDSVADYNRQVAFFN